MAAAQIHGLRTNRELLVRILEHPEFLAGKTDTHFLERHDPAELAAPLGDQQAHRLHAAAAALAGQAQRRRTAKVLALAPSGWRNNPSQWQQTQFGGPAGELAVEYQFTRRGLQIRVDGEELSGAVFQAHEPEKISLEVDGVRRTYDVHRVGDTFYIDSPLGSSELEEVPRFAVPQDDAVAGSLVAPLPGVVNEVRVTRGDTVEAGEVLLVIDSMKMLHWISAPLAGRIAELRVEAGTHVDAGTLLAVIEELT